MSFKTKDRGTRKTAGEGVKRKEARSDDSGFDKELYELTLDDLARSGLDRSDARKLKLQPLTREQTDDFCGEERASYKIPYFDLEGREIAYSRVRFLESHKKKAFKSAGKFKSGNGSFRYSQPFNSTPHVYFPPYFSWKKISVDPTEKILITEGEKKAAAACKLGIHCIALGGVWAFKSTKRIWDLIPELQNIDWKDRDVEICYDADVMVKTEVRNALTTLALTLSQSYGVKSISFIFLDAEVAGNKTGLDDFLLDRGKEAFENIERQPYKAAAKIQLLNQKLCYVNRKGKFYDIENDLFFPSFSVAKDKFMNFGEEMVDGKRAVPIIELWHKNSARREVHDIVYEPGQPEVTEQNCLNTWRPTHIQPKKAKPTKWLDLVHYIFRKPEYAEYFLKWLAYPIQHPGAKNFQAVFVYGAKQGVGKTMVVDPVMEMVYGAHNFHRLQNTDLLGKFNNWARGKLFVVTNEVYLPDYADRRQAMGALKDMITREKLEVNIKYEPERTYIDHLNYYFTSNHADALALEPDDRRFFVVEAPSEKLAQTVYDELDEWIRDEGSSVILHYLQNRVDTSDFNHRGDAMMTGWKKQIIGLSKDVMAEFIDRVVEDPQGLLMMNGHMPDLQLYRSEDLRRVFEREYPKIRFNVSSIKIGRALKSAGIERRKVRLSEDSPLQSLFAVFERPAWKENKNRDWAEHYRQQSKMFGGKTKIRN